MGKRKDSAPGHHRSLSTISQSLGNERVGEHGCKAALSGPQFYYSAARATEFIVICIYSFSVNTHWIYSLLL